MDIKTYINSKKTYVDVGFFRIDIGFGFSSVHQLRMGIRCGYQNLGQFQKTYINI
jgi:hypothetical protein